MSSAHCLSSPAAYPDNHKSSSHLNHALCVNLPRQHVEALQSTFIDVQGLPIIKSSSCQTVLMACRLAGALGDKVVAASMLSCFRAVLRAGAKSKVSLITFGAHAVQQHEIQQRPLSNLATGEAATPWPLLHRSLQIIMSEGSVWFQNLVHVFIRCHEPVNAQPPRMPKLTCIKSCMQLCCAVNASKMRRLNGAPSRRDDCGFEGKSPPHNIAEGVPESAAMYGSPAGLLK